MDMTGQWLSAKDLAALNLRGLRIPGSERGCRNLAKREKWPSREVQGKGGKGGVKTLYRPPDPMLAAIAALALGESEVASYPKSTSAREPKDAPYAVPKPTVDAALLQDVIDLFYAWLDENSQRFRVDRSRHGLVISVLYRYAAESGGVVKADLERVLRAVA